MTRECERQLVHRGKKLLDPRGHHEVPELLRRLRVPLEVAAEWPVLRMRMTTERREGSTANSKQTNYPGRVGSKHSQGLPLVWSLNSRARMSSLVIAVIVSYSPSIDDLTPIISDRFRTADRISYFDWVGQVVCPWLRGRLGITTENSAAIAQVQSLQMVHFIASNSLWLLNRRVVHCRGYFCVGGAA